MQSVLKCLLLAVCVAATLAVPAHMTGFRQRRYAYPARAMMFSGYFRGQYPQQQGFRHYVPRNYEPEGAMTAFAAGNTVSAGSFLGNGNQPAADCTQCNGNGNYPSADEDTNGPPPEVIPTTNEGQPPYTGDAPSYPEGGNGEQAPEEAPATEASVDPNSDVPEEIPEETAAPVPPPTNGNGYGNGNGNGNGNGHRNGNDNGNGHRNGNGNGRGNGAKTPSTPRSDEDDAEEEDDSFPGSFPPGKKPRGRGNFYNTYFPMIFGSYPGSRNGGSGEPFPGAATAIANSFSTGRGAVATSHATAYGGPHYLGSNGSRKGNSRRPTNSS